MGRSFKIGTIGGTAIRVHITFALLLVWIWFARIIASAARHRTSHFVKVLRNQLLRPELYSGCSAEVLALPHCP
ncbi:Zn-dependent protease [Rhizobium beringeri]|jgi:Zn-dependent protease